MTHKSSVLCIDRQGDPHKRHYWGGDLSRFCWRCMVNKREWDKTRARRRAGELLVGERGEIVELTNASREA